MLSEREAWLKLAEIWDSPIVKDNAELGLMGHRAFVEIKSVFGSPCGLCPCINVFHYLDWIDSGTAHVIHKKIPESRSFDGYVWPRTVEGAKQRAAFCREQADALRLSSVQQ
jgi:hypothetical protein